MENVWSSKDGDNTADEKLTNEDLYNEQIELLKTFLKNGAIVPSGCIASL